MSRLARRRGHAVACPTRLGRSAIRGAAKKQPPDASAAARVACIWRSRRAARVMQDCKMAAGVARDLRSRAPRDAPWRTRKRWSSTRTSWRGPPRRRGRSGTRPSCLCTHARDGVRRDGVNGALSSRARETRRLPGRIAPVDWSARSTSAFALNRFRRRFQTQNDESSQASVDRSTSQKSRNRFWFPQVSVQSRNRGWASANPG